MYKVVLVTLLFMMCGIHTKAADTFYVDINQSEMEVIHRKLFIEDSSIHIMEVDTTSSNVKFKRGKAILFTIFTGFLGGHRIYLGTHHRTPILYSVTLGGLGILPIIDLIHILFTKDLTVFENKTQIIMWSK